MAGAAAGLNLTLYHLFAAASQPFITASLDLN